VIKYFKRSKAFIIPSLWEDPGFVLIEAMLSNTLVISSDCPSGPKEILKNNRGILFKNNNKSDFIEKFNFLTSLNNKQKLEKKKLAKKFVKRFTLLSHHNKLVNLFN
jgi:glycosyltransferase involved in cell wall biosynthesis